MGIEPTKDEKSIIAAYRGRLKSVNPEDHPEEFKQLREAYEEALALSKQEEIWANEDNEDSKANGPVFDWLKRVEQIYNDFSSRVNVKYWKELFQDETYVALDLRAEAEDALLRYLMSHWYLPQTVWQNISDVLDVRGRVDELSEIYSREFIEQAIIAGAVNQSLLPYDLFTPGVNGEECDHFINLWRKSLYTNDKEELASIIEELKNVKETHPYEHVLNFRLFLYDGKTEEAENEIKGLVHDYPDDIYLQTLWINYCLDNGMEDEAANHAEGVLKLNSDNRTALIALAECSFRAERFEEAKEKLYDLLDMLGLGDPLVDQLKSKLQGWNESYIAKLELQDNLTFDETINLAWCYLQNNRNEDCIRICEDMSLDAVEDLYRYHDVLGKAYFYSEKVAEAYEHIHSITEFLKTLEDDGTEKIGKRIKKYPDFLRIEAICLRRLGRDEEAEAIIKDIERIAPENIEFILQNGVDSLNKNDYQKALESFDRILLKKPNSPNVHYLRGLALYELFRDKEAYDAVDTALKSNGSQLEYYALKLDILIREEAWEAVHEVMDFLKQNKLDELCLYQWYIANLTEKEQKNKEKAVSQYYEVAKRFEAGENLMKPADLYYRILCLDGGDPKMGLDFAKMMGLLDKGLKSNPNHMGCLLYKAWVFKKKGNLSEALDLYHKVEQYPSHGINVETCLAYTYYDANDRERAFHYFQILLERNPDDLDALLRIGYCYNSLKEYGKAEDMFKKVIELSPDSTDGYNGLRLVYECTKQYEKALEQIGILLEKDDDPDKIKFHLGRKYKLLCRLARPLEAVAALEERDRMTKNSHSYSDMFEVYIRYKMWYEAEKVIKNWKKAKNAENEWYYAKLKLAFLRGESKILRKFARQMLFKNIQRKPTTESKILCNYYEYKCKWKKANNVLRWAVYFEPESIEYLCKYVWVSYLYGNKCKAQEKAEKLLSLLNQVIPAEPEYESLHRAEKVAALAVLGREEEARRELEIIRAGRVCGKCMERFCKGADIYEIILEEISGNIERALKIAENGLKECPNEIDFLLALIRLKKKRKKLKGKTAI